MGGVYFQPILDWILTRNDAKLREVRVANVVLVDKRKRIHTSAAGEEGMVER